MLPRCGSSSSGVIPLHTRAAVHALLAVEQRDAVRTRRDRLPRAHFDAHLDRAALAEIRIDEAYVVGIAAGRLHLAAHQQGVLVGDQQLAVVWNGGPSAPLHQSAVAGDAAVMAAPLQSVPFARRDFGPGGCPP